jgi:hypothetical protein
MTSTSAHGIPSKKRSASVEEGTIYLFLPCCIFTSFFLTINHLYYSETPTNKKKVATKTQKNTKPKKKRNSTKNKEGVEDNGKIKESNGSSYENESKKRIRARNYNDHEDVQICTSWLETTEDGRKGTDQTGDAFWETIT